MKDQLLYLAPLTTVKEVDLVDLFGFVKHVPHLGVLLQPIYQVTEKTATFVWGPEEEKVLQGPSCCEGCSTTRAI